MRPTKSTRPPATAATARATAVSGSGVQHASSNGKRTDRSRPDHECTCTLQLPLGRPEHRVTETPCKSAACRFIRPERTSESQIAEQNYCASDELPNIESRQRVARAIRDFLARRSLTVTAFAAMHGVNEKQAAKWLDGRANYPAWGFDILSDEMSFDLFASIREAKGATAKWSPMKRALGWLRRDGTKADVFAAQRDLLEIAMSKDGTQ